jgi:hypothetical protein
MTLALIPVNTPRGLAAINSRVPALFLPHAKAADGSDVPERRFGGSCDTPRFAFVPGMSALAFSGRRDLQRDGMLARLLRRHIHRQFGVSLHPLEFAFVA